MSQDLLRELQLIVLARFPEETKLIRVFRLCFVSLSPLPPSQEQSWPFSTKFGRGGGLQR